MDKLSHIYIPKRLYERFHAIYCMPLTVVAAPDGFGKTSMVTEFVKRSRPDGYTCRFITSGLNEDDCFRKYCKIVLGHEEPIPITADDFNRLKIIFAAAKLAKPTVVIMDCHVAEKMVLANLYCAKLMAQYSKANTVVICSPLGQHYGEMIDYCGGQKIAQEELRFTEAETSQYLSRCHVPQKFHKIIHSVTAGEAMKVHIYMLLKTYSIVIADGSADTISLISELMQLFPRPIIIAAICASAFERLDEFFFSDLSQCAAVKSYFGSASVTEESIYKSLEFINSIMPLIYINRKKGIHDTHVLFKHGMLRLFGTLPESVRCDLHGAVANEYTRNGKTFRAFLQYIFMKDYYTAGYAKKKEHVSFELLLKCQDMLYDFVSTCPFDCKPIIPKLLRLLSLLMITPYKEKAKPIFTRLIAYLNSAPDYTPKERSNMLCYAYTMRTYEDFFLLEKMGNHIKRAYEYFRGLRVPHSPFTSWAVYSPSIFSIIHRYSLPLSTEMEQFTRYMKMYTEMVQHGELVVSLYTAECCYFTMNFDTGMELALKTAEQCIEERFIASKLCSLNTAARCAIMAGNYSVYRQCLDDISGIMREANQLEISDMGGVIMALLCCIKSGSSEEVWKACAKEDSELLVNRYTAPFSFFARCFSMFSLKKYDELLSLKDFYLKCAGDVRNETILLMMKLVFSNTYFVKNDEENCLSLLTEIAETLKPSGIIMPAVEFSIHAPRLFNYGRENLPQYADFFDEVLSAAVPLRKNVETLRTKELTGISKRNRGADSAIIAMECSISDLDDIRIQHRLTKNAVIYAVLAAKHYSNDEISEICGCTTDSVKSSLKRTFKKLGIKHRSQLKYVLRIME